MNKKDLEMRNKLILLADIYGELLTEKQYSVLEMYFFEDLSLSEISKINNSSRQSVLDSVNKSITQLLMFEEKLGILEKEREFILKKNQLLDKLRNFIDLNEEQELYLFIKNL